MNAATVAALRELLGREDVIEAAAKALYECDPDPDVPTWEQAWAGFQDANRAAVRSQLAAVLELAATLPSFPPPPVLSTITDDERVDHPQPGDEPSDAVPPWVDGWPVRRFNVDPKSYTLPDAP